VIQNFLNTKKMKKINNERFALFVFPDWHIYKIKREGME